VHILVILGYYFEILSSCRPDSVYKNTQNFFTFVMPQNVFGLVLVCEVKERSSISIPAARQFLS